MRAVLGRSKLDSQHLNIGETCIRPDQHNSSEMSIVSDILKILDDPGPKARSSVASRSDYPTADFPGTTLRPAGIIGDRRRPVHSAGMFSPGVTGSISPRPGEQQSPTGFGHLSAGVIGQSNPWVVGDPYALKMIDPFACGWRERPNTGRHRSTDGSAPAEIAAVAAPRPVHHVPDHRLAQQSCPSCWQDSPLPGGDLSSPAQWFHSMSTEDITRIFASTNHQPFNFQTPAPQMCTTPRPPEYPPWTAQLPTARDRISKRTAPVTNKAAQDRKIWYHCDVCDCNVSSEYQFKIHTEGIKHRKRLSMLQGRAPRRHGLPDTACVPREPLCFAVVPCWGVGQYGQLANCITDSSSVTFSSVPRDRCPNKYDSDSEYFSGSDIDSVISDN